MNLKHKLKLLLCIALVMAITGSIFVSSSQANEIHDAIVTGSVVDYDILKKDKIDEEDLYGNTPLEVAIAYDRCDWADALIQAGANLENARNGRTPLFFAAINYQESVVRTLLEKNADVNLCTLKEKVTPLHGIACKYCMLYGEDKLTCEEAKQRAISAKNIIVDLLKKGANPKAINTFGSTSLARIVKHKPHRDKNVNEILSKIEAEIIDEILKYSGKVDVEDCYIKVSVFEAVKNGNVMALNKLIEHNKAVVNVRDFSRNTSLHWAIRVGNTTMAKSLLNYSSIDINAQNAAGDTPLHWANEVENIELINHLLRCPNIDVNRQNAVGDTPLHKAIYKKNFDAVCKLVDAGADVTRCNTLGLTPRDLLESNFSVKNLIAVQKKIHNREIEQLMNTETLHSAIVKGNVELVNRFLARDDAINTKDKKAQTPLQVAITCGRADFVKLLLRKGATVDSNWLFSCANQDIVDVLGKHISAEMRNELLFKAVQNKNMVTLKALLHNGANVNARNKDGKTLLNLAIAKKNVPVISELLNARGINVNLSNDDGETPIMLAVKSKCKEDVIKKLLEKGASVDSKIIDSASGKVRQLLTDAKQKATVKKLQQTLKKQKKKQVQGTSSKSAVVADATESRVGSSQKYTTEKEPTKGRKLSIQVDPPRLETLDQRSATTTDKRQVTKDTETNTNETSQEGRCESAAYKMKRKPLENSSNLPQDSKAQQKAEQKSLSASVKSDEKQKAKPIANAVANLQQAEDSGNEDCIFTVVERQDVEVVSKLISENPSLVNLQNVNGDTPLHLALIKNNADMIKLLLSAVGVDVNKKNKQGNTLLHLAVLKNNAAAVEMLLSQDAVNVNLKNNEDNTPLQLMVQYNRSLLMDMLLKQESLDVNMPCGVCGFTPLHWAVALSNVTIAEKLLKCEKIKIDAKNKLGQTAFEMIMDKDSKLFELLKR